MPAATLPRWWRRIIHGWGDRGLPLDPHLAGTVKRLREWARTAGPRDVFCVGTKYGSLAFFKSQINAARADHQLETVLRNRIEQARTDLEARGVVPKSNINEG